MKNRLIPFIWSFIRPQRGVFFAALLISLGWSLDTTLWPFLTGKVVDILVQYEGDRASVWSLLKYPVVAALSLWTLIELSFRIQGKLLAYFFPKLEASIRISMFDHIQRHSPKYFNDRFAGNLANKITDMTTQATQALSQLLWTFLPPAASCVLCLFFLSRINLMFTAIFGLLLLIYGAICWHFTKRCQEYERQHSEARSSLLGKIVDALTNNFAVNLFYRFAYEKSYIARYQKEEQKKNIEAKKYAEKMRACLSLTFFIGGISMNGLMLYLWGRHEISTGEVVQTFNMLWNIIMVLWMAGIELPIFFQSVGVMKQALAVMEDPQDIADAPNAASLIIKKGEIVFDNVSFDYGKKNLFRNKQVVIRGGEKVGLVGYSGSGKSTFVNLILRFYPVEKGRILIDGQDVAGVTLESLRSQVALIPQEPLLFHRTLEENIRYGRVDASKEEIIRAAKLAHCDEFIQRNPAGYDALVGERGMKLSGGERQRIAIARAMLSNAPILILDEATSALDSVTEKYIQSSLEHLMQNRTTLVIAHRLSTLAKMDRVLVFDQGNIMEQGSHKSLMAKKGLYARLWQVQAGGFLPGASEGIMAEG